MCQQDCFLSKTFVTGNVAPFTLSLNDVIFRGFPLVISVVYLHNEDDTVLYVTLSLNLLLCQTLHTTYILQGLFRICIFISLVHKSFTSKQIWSKHSGYKPRLSPFKQRPSTTCHFVDTNHGNTNPTAIL